MRKFLCALFLVCLAAFLAVSCACADGTIGDDEALAALLNRYREEGRDSFEIELEKAYFDELRPSSFYRLFVLTLKCGMAEKDLKYSTSGTLLFAGVVWETPAVAECTTKEEVDAALESFRKEGTDAFQLICPEDLCNALGQDYFFSWMAQHGTEDFDFQWSLYYPRVYYFSNIRPYEIPWAAAADEDAFRNAVEDMRQSRTDDFYIVMERDFYNTLREDREKLRLLANASGMDAWSSSGDTRACRYRFSGVAYTDDPCLLCSTESEIREAVRQMGAAGIRTFRLILPRELYDRMKADSFAALETLTAEAGMTEKEMKYSIGGTTVFYNNAVIQSDLVKLNTAEEALAYTCACAAEGKTDIPLFCAGDLYTQLVSGISPYAFANDGMAQLYDVLAEAGILQYSFSRSAATGIINVKVESYYPGTNILRAVQTGDPSALSPRERETMEEALRLSGQLRQGTPLETARSIHDWLCERITYTDDRSTDEDDTAVGAILSGKANCDGYADAFYLLGTLSGLNVRYQHGDSNLAGRQKSLLDDATHMWNLLEIDGTWRLVDVTWDDDDGQILYTWFNIGEDRAARTHIWNRETTVPLLAETDLSVRPENEYRIRGAADVTAALDDIAANGFDSFTLIYDSAEADTHTEELDTLSRAAADSFHYSWEDRMRMLTVSGFTPR